jgi:hypothetical protein
MLTLTQHTIYSLPHPFPTLEAMLAEPFPRTPQDMMQLEQRLSTAAAQTADQIVLAQLTRAHEDEPFVRQAIAQTRMQGLVPLVHKGLRTTSVLLLLGGTRIIIETPYLCEARQSRRVRVGARAGEVGRVATRSLRPWGLPIASARLAAWRSPCMWSKPPATSKPPRCLVGAA